MGRGHSLEPAIQFSIAALSTATDCVRLFVVLNSHITQQNFATRRINDADKEDNHGAAPGAAVFFDRVRHYQHS